MKKINRLAAAMAVALSMTAVPQANAEIEFHPSGRGDALLFPVFNGYIENYFTIMNNHDKWIQGHLRFRGAAWSGELRDMDIILSPGDVFVFRVADVDGDGMWEIDQSLDLRNFQYTGLGGTPNWGDPSKDGVDDNGVNQCSPGTNTAIRIRHCMDPSEELIPTWQDLAKQMNGGVLPTDSDFINGVKGIIDSQRNTGYVEFIGEAVLDGMDYNIMQILLGPNPGGWAPYQTKKFSHRGTTAWAWSQAFNNFTNGHGLSDVPNALSGTAFITVPGIGHGLAYNAEALVNFRTGTTDHRIDNYRFSCTSPGQTSVCAPLDFIGTPITLANRAVIVHDENALGPVIASPNKPYGDYLYGFIDDLAMEGRISFNNTWGPTMSDGDDYSLVGLRPTSGGGGIDDDFDALPSGVAPHGLGVPNSVAEVEEAIRLGVSKLAPAVPGPETFTAYYMQGDVFDKSCQGNGSKFPWNQSFCPPLANPPTLTTLNSQYILFFPTKFFYGESSLQYQSPTLKVYIVRAVTVLLNLNKPANIEVWNNFEASDTCGDYDQPGTESLSPAISTPPTHGGGCNFPFELDWETIQSLIRKIELSKGSSYTSPAWKYLAGRVVIDFPTVVNDPLVLTDPLHKGPDKGSYERSWPGLLYTFEWNGGSILTHWRPMHRMHK